MLSWDQSRDWIKQLHQQHKSVVFTNGCFDILHVGHVRYLQQARECGDALIIGLNSDASVQGLKGPERPIVPEDERGELLEALKCVDAVVLFDQETPWELLNHIRPDVLAKGGDYRIETIVGADLIQSYGGQVKVLPFVDGKSTTNVVERIRRLG